MAQQASFPDAVPQIPMGEDAWFLSCTAQSVVLYNAEWQQQTLEHKKRTDQLILDTSAREAELLLRNSELTQEVTFPSSLPDAVYPAAS